MNPVSAITPNAATGDQSSAAAFSTPSVSSDTSGNGPSVTVDLSDNAKAALAAANENQNAANRILVLLMQTARAIRAGATQVAIGPTANPVSNKSISNLPGIFLRIRTAASHRKAMC